MYLYTYFFLYYTHTCITDRRFTLPMDFVDVSVKSMFKLQVNTPCIQSITINLQRALFSDMHTKQLIAEIVYGFCCAKSLSKATVMRINRKLRCTLILVFIVKWHRA